MLAPARHLRRATQWLLVLVASIGIALVGCANPNAGSEPAASGASASGAFPVTVATKFGNVTVQTQPARVVALGWGDAETALALGVQPVGASDWLQFGKGGRRSVGGRAVHHPTQDHRHPRALVRGDRRTASRPDLGHQELR
jgi:hypothetical protein